MNIDIKPIESYWMVDGIGKDVEMCYENEVRDLEAKYQEALTEISDVVKIFMVLEKSESLIGTTVSSGVFKKNYKEFLEKATGKKWKEAN